MKAFELVKSETADLSTPLRAVEKRSQERSAEPQVPPLRLLFRFPVELGGVGAPHAASLTKAANAAMSSAAWQEIQVRSG